MQPMWLQQVRRFSTFGFFIGVAALVAQPCRADNKKWSTDSIIKAIVHEVVGIGGYEFTDSSARAVVGTPKFASNSTLYVKPAHRYGVLITGGIELFNIQDHWQPFSGGNQFRTALASGSAASRSAT